MIGRHGISVEYPRKFVPAKGSPVCFPISTLGFGLANRQQALRIMEVCFTWNVFDWPGNVLKRETQARRSLFRVTKTCQKRPTSLSFELSRQLWKMTQRETWIYMYHWQEPKYALVDSKFVACFSYRSLQIIISVRVIRRLQFLPDLRHVAKINWNCGAS